MENKCCKKCRTNIMLPVDPPMVKCRLDYHCPCHQPSEELMAKIAKHYYSIYKEILPTDTIEEGIDYWRKFVIPLFESALTTEREKERERIISALTDLIEKLK